jgi:ribosome-associated protein
MTTESKQEARIRFPAALERAAALALERKADDVIGLDLKGISTATDYFLLATGRSDIQVQAIAEHLIDELKKDSIRPSHVEGLQEGRWVLVDYFDFVVHIFHPTTREYYQLETLWGDAPRRTFHE